MSEPVPANNRSPRTDRKGKESRAGCFLFERRAPAFITTLARCLTPTEVFSGNTERCTSPTILCTTKSFISRPRSRFSKFRYAVCAHRRADLLGPVVSGGIADYRARRRSSDFLSHKYRLASHEKSQFGAAQLDAWHTVQRGHAIANGMYAAVVNRVGFEGKPEKGDPGLEFWAIPSSLILRQVISEASNDKEEILVVECDPAKSEDTRRNWPFLRDRRVDAYQPS